eukprot:TRINITY_DN81698_c0_g1_i1.p1 TRINITY_DN81698_c0_g1~~TRINITY_DN81698_c0_g1_i1.p1  ORF type:complete len:292 (-),score=22.28 TRINITY_DN81698_c0_g1_i1:37-912(-)
MLQAVRQQFSRVLQSHARQAVARLPVGHAPASSTVACCSVTAPVAVGPLARPCSHTLAAVGLREQRTISTMAHLGRSLATHCRNVTIAPPVQRQQPAGVRSFSTRSLCGRMFYRRRPRMCPRFKFNWRSKWLEGNPIMKGVCTKVMVKGAKKPNSGLRKVAMVRLRNGRVVQSYIPGIGHNLQVHSVVMVRGGRHRDTIGCNYTCMRGHYDLLPVKGRLSRRSKFGVSRPNFEPNRKRFKRLTTAVDRRLHYYRTGDQLGPDDAVPQRIPYHVRAHPPVTYKHSLKRPSKK